MREYKDKLRTGKEPDFNPEYEDVDWIMTIEQWNRYKDDLWDQGSEYWVKDGIASRDSPYETPQEDATHVVFYMK